MRTTVAARGRSAPDQDSGRGRCIDEGIGEAHRVAGGRPQVCINFKMVGQMLEKRGIAAFAKSVADVCDTLAASDESPRSRSPETNR